LFGDVEGGIYGFVEVGSGGRLHFLVKATAPEIVSNDDIRDGIKDKLHILGVCGAGHVTVDLLGCRLVLCLKLGLDVGSSLSIFLGTSILMEADSKGGPENLFFKEIFLVEELSC